MLILSKVPQLSKCLKGDVEFDVKNQNSSIVFLYMKSKCANSAWLLLDQ